MRFASDGRVAIRPVTPMDYELLHQLATTPGVGDRWRGYRPDVSVETFVASLWAGVLEQAVVFRVTDERLIGLVSAYNAEPRSQTCSLGVVEHPDHLGTGGALIGAGLFLNDLFGEWGMRKVYLEVYEPNLASMESIVGRVATRDGVLRGAKSWNGSVVDQHLLTIDRDAWMTDLGGVLARRAARFEAAQIQRSSVVSGGDRAPVS